MWNGKSVRAFSAVMILLITVFVLGCQKPSNEVAVPDVTGMTQTEAETAITSAGLAVGTITEASSDTVPTGQVVTQNPIAGANVAPGSAVALVFSRGPEPAIVPNVVGMTQSAAESAITGAELTVGVLSEQYSDNVPAGQVVSQDPMAGASVAPSSTVALVISRGPERAEFTEFVDGTGGRIELGEAVLTIPSGALQEATNITLERNREGAQVQLSENEQVKSEIYTITHDAGFPVPTLTEPFSLELLFDTTIMQESEINRSAVYLRITTEEGSSLMMGMINENSLKIDFNSLPTNADVQVVFNPNMHRVVSEIDDVKTLTQNPPWRTTRWECNYDPTLNALRQAVADIRGIALSSVTNAIVEEVILEKVANNARDGAKYYQNLGLRGANLQIIQTGGLTLMTINIGSYSNGPHYNNDATSFGQLNLDADYLRDSYLPIYNTVLDVISHEMFHACFNGYELNTTNTESRASKGFNEGLATVMGPTIDNGVLTVRSTAVHKLNNSIGAPGNVAYDNDDWFAYLGKRFDDGSLLYVGGHGTDGTGASNGLLEQMRLAIDGQTFSTQDAALEEYRNAMQQSLESQFALDLSEIYWDYARNRAYERNDESRLRPGDSNLSRYSLDASVFDSVFIHNHAFASDHESVTISHGTESMLKDIAPLSSRAIVLSANGFTSDITLTFNTSEWVSDALGHSMFIKVYKEGQDGVELQSDNDEIHLTGFGEGTTKSPFGSVIILMSNVSLDKDYSIEMTATTSPASEATGALGGRVTDAGTGLPLEDVAVTVREQGWIWTGDVLDTAVTDANGQFLVGNLPSGNVELAFEKDGYITTTQNATVVEDTTTQINATLIVIDTGEPTGNASGRVMDAVTGLGVNGVNLVLRSGILQLTDVTGDIVASTTTNAGGDYSFTNINAGTYTVFASKAGYTDDVFVIFFVGGETRSGQNGDISPIVAEGEVRIVLTWGATPYDLDSHLTGPSSSGSGRFHLYYPYAEANGGGSESGHVELDLDDVSSYGPETTTIHVRYPGTYRFSVHDYSNLGSTSSTAMSNSGANVKVITDSDTREFNIHPNTPATLWTVFEIDGETGAITGKDEYTFTSSPSAVTKTSNRTNTLGSEVPSLVSNMPPKE